MSLENAFKVVQAKELAVTDVANINNRNMNDIHKI